MPKKRKPHHSSLVLPVGVVHRSKKKVQPIEHIAQIIKDLGMKGQGLEDYLPSTYDKPELVKILPVAALRNITNGQGVFAKKTIQKGVVVGEYTGLKYTQKDFKQLTDDSYAMELGDHIIDAKEKRNFTAYINQSVCQANVEFIIDDSDNNAVRVRAIRKIAPGEQLLIDYNTPSSAENNLFLNPSDDDKSPSEFKLSHADVYQAIPTGIALPLFNCQKDTVLWASEIGIAILNKTALTRTHNAQLTNYPCINKENPDDSDTISPLMLACYLGQTDNVMWLLKQGAHLNHQQHRSGVYPLFATLQGYAANPQLKENYIIILTALVCGGANALTYDKTQTPFFHEAARILSSDDFATLVGRWTVNQKPLKEIFCFLDTDDHDIVLFCFKHKLIDHAIVLLTAFPDYVQNDLSGSHDLTKINRQNLLKIIAKFSKDEQAMINAKLLGTEIHRLIFSKEFSKVILEQPQVKKSMLGRPKRQLAINHRFLADSKEKEASLDAAEKPHRGSRISIARQSPKSNKMPKTQLNLEKAPNKIIITIDSDDDDDVSAAAGSPPKPIQRSDTNSTSARFFYSGGAATPAPTIAKPTASRSYLDCICHYLSHKNFLLLQVVLGSYRQKYETLLNNPEAYMKLSLVLRSFTSKDLLKLSQVELEGCPFIIFLQCLSTPMFPSTDMSHSRPDWEIGYTFYAYYQRLRMSCCKWLLKEQLFISYYPAYAKSFSRDELYISLLAEKNFVRLQDFLTRRIFSHARLTATPKDIADLQAIINHYTPHEVILLNTMYYGNESFLTFLQRQGIQASIDEHLSAALTLSGMSQH